MKYAKVIQRSFFLHSSSKSEEILELIHSDICNSLMIILENVEFIFLKLKSETFTKEFKVLVEIQTEKHFQILRSENGSFCKETSIKR
jgi:hypothetical protein